MAWYFGGSTVVTCMRAGLYQTKKGLLVFLGSLRSRKSITLPEISSSTVLDRSNVSGPSSLHFWFASGLLAVLTETPRHARRWALLGVLLGEPLRRSARHHFRWAREQAIKDPERWSPMLREPR